MSNTRKLVKTNVFDERIRPRLTFSDPAKIRLNSKTRQLELMPTGFDESRQVKTYPLDADLSVTIAATNPKALQQWIGFCTFPHVSKQPANTSVGFKLNDGTTTQYWNGAAWVAAGASNWNTEAEIAANIGTFPAAPQTLSIIINLRTTDKLVTPVLQSVDVLMQLDISYLRSLIVDSLVPELKADMEPSIDAVRFADGGTTTTLKDQENPYDILDVLAVYDQQNDPEHQTNLRSAYNPTTKIITLTGAVTKGRHLWVIMKVKPKVYINWASQDYLEVETIPAIAIDRFDTEGHDTLAVSWVHNVNTNQAVVNYGALRQQISFDVLLLAEGNRDAMEMWDSAQEFIQTHPTLQWRAVDEPVTLVLEDTGDHAGRPNLSDKHQMRLRFQLRDIYLWLRPAEDVPLVTQFIQTIRRQRRTA